MRNNNKSPDNKRIQDEYVVKSTFPPVDYELLKALDLQFPNVMCSLRADDRKIGQKIGEIGVVNFLRDIYNSQNEKD